MRDRERCRVELTYYARRVGLSRRSRRAYLEAYHQATYGAPSTAWRVRSVINEDLEVWMMAFDIAKYDDISPWDALLLAVKRRASRVRAVDNIINAAWEDHRRLCEADPTYGNPDVPDEAVRKWMIE